MTTLAPSQPILLRTAKMCKCRADVAGQSHALV